MINYIKPVERPRINIQIDRKQHELYLLNLNSLDNGVYEAVVLNVVPENVTESYQQRIMTESLYGTISPQYFYTGGENKTISFSITLIEDEHNESNSIYKLRDKIKRMGMPIYKEGVLKEPLIYFELGDQFAGKGFINSEFTLRGPFRNNRYIVMDVGITITLVEEYEQPEYKMNQRNFTYIDTSGLTLDLEDLDILDYSIEDLFIDIDDRDITLIKDFAFQKATSKVFNKVNHDRFYGSAKELEEGLRDYEVKSSNDKEIITLYERENYKANKALQKYYDLWYDYILITASKMFTIQARINNLDKLIKKVQDYHKQIKNRELEVRYGLLTYDEEKKLMEEVEKLEKTIMAQINLYSAMGGATT